MKRVLCIRLPSWSIQRLVVAQPELKGRAIVLHRRDARGGSLVAACSRAAYGCGVRIGMPLAEATALDLQAPGAQVPGAQVPGAQAPNLRGKDVFSGVPQGAADGRDGTAAGAPHVVACDFEADRKALEELARWCEQFSPIVGFEHPGECAVLPETVLNEMPGCLFLDVTGLESYFGGEHHLARQVAQAFDRRGYRVRVAIADTLGAAWALAHFAARRAQPVPVQPVPVQPVPAQPVPVQPVPVQPVPISRQDSPRDPARTAASSFLVVPSAATFAALSPLPIEALRLPASTAALLRQLGISQVGQLAHLPRAGLFSRFGETLLKRWDQAMGLAEEVLLVHRPTCAVGADWSLEAPTAQGRILLSILEELVRRVARSLADRGQGAMELVCRLACQSASACDASWPDVVSATRQERSDAKQRNRPQHNQDHSRSPTQAGPAQADPVQADPAKADPAQADPAQAGPAQAGPVQAPLSFHVVLFQPTVSVPHLMQLFETQLEHRVLPGPVEQLRVEVLSAASLERRQRELFSDRVRYPAHHLAQLIDRLTNRLGRQRVLRAELQAAAQPELAYRYRPLTGHGRSDVRLSPPAPGGKRHQPLVRPLHLRSPPVPLEVLAIAPDGPPVQLSFQRDQYHIARCWGPERIETGWWRGRSVRRDYYRVETDRGYWFWLFRQLNDGRWFLHGVFG